MFVVIDDYSINTANVAYWEIYEHPTDADQAMLGVTFIGKDGRLPLKSGTKEELQEMFRDVHRLIGKGIR